MFTLPSPIFHYELSDLYLDKSIKFLDIEAPREYAKSSIYGCLAPLHHIHLDPDPGPKFVLLISKTQGHAINLLQTIKDVYDYSMSFRDFFGYWGRHSARIWTKDTVILKDGTILMAKGTGQQVHGLKVGHQRPTLILVDDPEDENNTKTTEAMEYNLRWLLSAAKYGLDLKRGRMIVIGTPLHERCIVETLKDMSTWTFRRYSCIQDDDTALWPEKETREEIEADKQSYVEINRSSYWYREKMCLIIGDEDQLFTQECIRYYDGDIQPIGDRECILTIRRKQGERKCEPDVIYDTPLRLLVYTFAGVDPASSTKQTADWSTYVPIARDADHIRYCLPYYRAHVKPHDLAQAILEKDDEFTPRGTRIETVGYQEMLKDEVRNNRYIPGIEVPVKPRTERSTRLEALQPPWYRGKIYLLGEWNEETQKWKTLMPEMEGEALMYPRGKHDDLLDGLWMANKCSYSPEDSTAPEHIGTIPKELQGEGMTPHPQYYNWKVL